MNSVTLSRPSWSGRRGERFLPIELPWSFPRRLIIVVLIGGAEERKRSGVHSDSLMASFAMESSG